MIQYLLWFDLNLRYCVQFCHGHNSQFNKVLFVGRGDVSDQTYIHNLMLNPQENDLYCSVIYLAAGDYHRFHSPANWLMLLRRHFAGMFFCVELYIYL